MRVGRIWQWYSGRQAGVYSGTMCCWRNSGRRRAGNAGNAGNVGVAADSCEAWAWAWRAGGGGSERWAMSHQADGGGPGQQLGAHGGGASSEGFFV